MQRINMTKKANVLITNNFHPETVRKLDEKYITHHLWNVPAPEQPQLISRLQGQCNAVATASWACDDIIYSLSSLRLIACFGVGVDGIDFNKIRDQGIRVSNTPNVLNDAVADIALALILATTRNLVNADRFVRAGHWKVAPFPFGYSLSAKTLGIIGFGRIGEEIAKRALTFGLNIAYHNRSSKDLPFDYFASIAELAEASDILLCMLPGGKETHKVINAEIFQKLGSNGIFINVGRGSSVDETALAEALEKRTILCAGLDVYADEPNVPEALLKLDNAVLLPHIGSATIETRRAMGNLVIKNLDAFFDQQPLLTEVT